MVVVNNVRPFETNGIPFERELEAMLRGAAVAVRLASRLEVGYKVWQPNAFDVLLYPPCGEAVFLSSEDFSTLHRGLPTGGFEALATGYPVACEDADAVADRVVDLLRAEPAAAST